MTAQITELIDKQDNSELVRDKIAAILKVEETNQQALATAAGKDPRLWALDVFVERSNPWEKWQDNPDPDLDIPPVVNVSFETSLAPEGGGNVSSRQQVVGTYNIDCYGYGVSRADGAGHVPGDLVAALASQRAMRLARNILMASSYVYLGLQGIVGKRWPQAITSMGVPLEGRETQHIVATRLEFRVQHNEFSPQFTDYDTVGLVSATVKRAETGEIYLVANYTGE